MTTDDNKPERARLNGCGWAALIVLSAFALAILYILFNFGSWLGSL